MPSFRTTLPPYQPGFEIDHSTGFMCIGSCFAQHIAQKLQKLKFSCDTNPFGILYNPLNIANCIQMICENHLYSENDITERDGHWFSWAHHSQVHDQSPTELMAKLQATQASAYEKLKSTDLYIFTFGTAYYYHHTASGIDVANCHKLPAYQFTKKRASVEDIVVAFSSTIQKIRVINPDAKFIVTVSPIRHVKDGITENTKSKAILHLAIEAITNQFDHAYYFPAYELMMDDLRDYRFYTSDLLHPSEVAIDYIWNHFKQHLFSESSHSKVERINTVLRAMEHRAFHHQSDAHQKFLSQTLNKISSLESENPNLDFSSERKKIEEELI